MVIILAYVSGCRGVLESAAGVDDGGFDLRRIGGRTRGVEIKFIGGKSVVVLEMTVLLLFRRALGSRCCCVALVGLLA